MPYGHGRAETADPMQAEIQPNKDELDYALERMQQALAERLE